MEAPEPHGEDDSVCADSQSWPSFTNFCSRLHGRSSLGDQAARVHCVLAMVIKREMPYFIMFKDTFPSEDDRYVYLHKALIHVAGKLREDGIKDRLLNGEPSYAKHMTKIVSVGHCHLLCRYVENDYKPKYHISNFHGKFKGLANKGVKGYFQLQEISSDSIVHTIAELIKTENYIYPCILKVHNTAHVHIHVPELMDAALFRTIHLISRTCSVTTVSHRLFMTFFSHPGA